MSVEKLNLIFPIETIVRELDYRLVLASLYAQKHHRIFLAHTAVANRLAATLPGGGLYVGKHIIATGGEKPELYYRAKENNFKVVHLSEEGAVFMGQEDDWGHDLDWQLRSSYLHSDDYVATWGDWQREYYIKQGVKPEQIHATGHPRFDIYKSGLANIYFEEVRQIRAKFGQFILVNSNLSWAVNPLGHADSFSRWQGYYPENEKARLRFVGRWSRQNQIFAELIELVHRLAARYPEFKIVIRPHPSDDMEQLKATVSGVENIHVIRQGSVAPWIMASQVMIHDGCTTAIEAYLLGKSAVNFSPIKNNQEAFLPNMLSAKAFSQEEAISLVDDLMRSDWCPREISEKAHRVFSNFNQDSMGLFKKILLKAEADLPRTALKSDALVMLSQIQHWLVEHSKHLARKAFFEKRYRFAMSTRVLFPGFNRQHIQSRLKSIGEITDRRLTVRHYSPWLLELNAC